MNKKETDDIKMDEVIADAAEQVIDLLRQQLKDETKVNVEYLLTGYYNVQTWMMSEMHAVVDWVHYKVMEAHELDEDYED